MNRMNESTKELETNIVGSLSFRVLVVTPGHTGETTIGNETYL